jgi:ferredoxin
MFLSTNTCDGKRDCIKQCPTKAIKFINGKAFSCLPVEYVIKTVRMAQYSKTAMAVT